jgi:mono/diheme cytochrome c family protein
MKHLQRRLPMILAAAAIFLLASACGRVNLEDLTPEAIRTEIAGRPTATPVPTRAAAGEGTAAPTSRTGSGNLAAGSSLYNAHCSGCHGTGGQPGRRAATLNGTELTFDDSPWLRTGVGGEPANHPTYTISQLTNNNLEDIFFYLQSQ